MSTPNSSVDVQTAVAGRSAFSAASSSSRSAFERLPWWGKNSSGTRASSESRRSRSDSSSTRFRLLAKTRLSVPRRCRNRCAAISSVGVGVSPSVDARARYPLTWSCRSAEPASLSTMSASAPPPGRRKSAAIRMSPSVAESAIRGRVLRVARSTRWSRLWSWRPRSVPMKAWSSSTTTYASGANHPGSSSPRRTNSASSDSGVMRRTPSGSRSAAAFRLCGTSPCHRCTDTPAASPISRSRPNWSLMSALSGLTYRTRKPGVVGASSARRERTGRNAASVFPLAVAAARITSRSPSRTARIAFS